MYHLLLTGCLIVITFGVLVRRYRVEAVYCLIVPFPTLIFLMGMVHEHFRGIQKFNHQVLHLAYDSSYVLLLVGLIIILRAILKRKLTILIVAGTCIAGIPIGYIFITQR
jgi:hypothetical protein